MLEVEERWWGTTGKVCSMMIHNKPTMEEKLVLGIEIQLQFQPDSAVSQLGIQMATLTCIGMVDGEGETIFKTGIIMLGSSKSQSYLARSETHFGVRISTLILIMERLTLSIQSILHIGLLRTTLELWT